MAIRKVRHPYQVLGASEMVVGQLYAFIYTRESGDDIDRYTMGGVIDDARATAQRLGHDLDSAETLKIEMLLTAPGAMPIVTVHMDGWWYVGNLAVAPTLMYWGTDWLKWDMLSTYLGPVNPAQDCDDRHYIVVPSKRWDDDPRVHVLDWINPHHIVKRRVLVAEEGAAGWEQRMRARAHAAMAKALGF